jgi:hypothetical protein
MGEIAGKGRKNKLPKKKEEKKNVGKEFNMKIDCLEDYKFEDIKFYLFVFFFVG